MKRILSLVVFWGALVSIQGQTISPDTILSRIWVQTNVFPQEKLYIQTDKTDYVAGETIWLRAFLADASTHQPAKNSRYVYVELVNPFNKVEQRVRLRRDSLNLIHGQIVLESSMADGEYSLRAYTRYMQNQGEDYFFRKSVKIISPYSKGMKMSVVWEGAEKLRVDFSNPITGQPMEVTNTLLLTEKDTLYHSKLRTGIKANIRSEQLKHRVLLLRAGNYGQYFSLPLNKEDFALSFFPEGGQMVPGCMNKIAFKALNNLGLGEKITGEVLTEKGDTVASFESFHRGMGNFSFIPKADVKYVARCRNDEGKEKTFHLPYASSSNVALKINRSQEMYYVSVLQSSLVENPTSKILIVHQRGIPKYVQAWNNDILHLTFNVSDFSDGIIHFLLADGMGNVISERLVFNDTRRQTEGTVLTDGKVHDSRSKIVLQLKAQAPDGTLLNGSAAVSVTNNYDTRPDSVNSILSTLLLTSELKGYVEAPHWYFQGDRTRRKQEALDLLMMTQGWRRYDMQSILNGNVSRPEFLYEENMSIKGKVVSNVLRKSVKNTQVRVAAPKVGMVELTSTDREGNFIFEGFEFPDTTSYLVSAISKSGKDNVTIQVAEENYPVVGRVLPPMIGKKSEEKYSYITKMVNKMTLENGIRHIFLDEVIVSAPRKIYKTETEYVADKVIKEEKLEQSGALNLSVAIRSIMGVNTRGEGNDEVKDVGYVLDGCELYKDDEINQVLNFMPKELFGQVELLRLPAALRYFLGTRSIVILLYTKRGGSECNASWNATNLAYITPLGYQQPVEFYSPVYENPMDLSTEMDLRSTVYWKPNLLFENGEAEVVFYAADGIVDYTMTVEGMDEKGNLLRIQQQIE